MLGRPGNNVKVGIVGVPNVGKSSFFNILGKMNVPAENFPFCTIDPNVAIVPVPDQRFKWLVKKYKPASEVPPNMTITDIAGLVKVRARPFCRSILGCTLFWFWFSSCVSVHRVPPAPSPFYES